MRAATRWRVPALLGILFGSAVPGAAAPRSKPVAPVSTARQQAAASLVRLLSDPSTAVQLQAMEALSRTRPPEAVPPLLPLLRSANPDRVNVAVELLASIGTREAILPLLRLAETGGAGMRVQVAQRLCYEPPALPEVRAFFERQSHSEDPQLRVIAAAAMGNMLLLPGTPNRLSPRRVTPAADPNALGSGLVPGG
jgi:HEAT repeat protein